MKKSLLSTGLLTAFMMSCVFVQASTPNQTTNSQTATLSPLQEKMLNAIDNYTSLEGTYHVMQKPINVDETVSFSIKEGPSAGSYAKHVDNRDGSIVEQTSDSNYVMSNNHKLNEFRKAKIDKSTFAKITTPRSFKNNKGEPVYVYRQDPAWATSVNEVAFPQTYAFWLNDPTTYSIVDHEQYLGRDATVIQGKMDPYIGQKHDATDYKIWVDSATGVLLKLVETNASGEVTNLIEVNSLKVDQPVDSSKFSVNAPAGEADKSMKN